MSFKEWLGNLFKKTSILRTDKGDTFYDIDDNIIANQIKLLSKRKSGFVVVENARGEWFQFLYFNKGNFFLERPGTELEIGRIKKLNIPDVTDTFMHFYNKQLDKNRLLKLCVSLIDQKFIPKKEDWEVEQRGNYKSADGFYYTINKDGFLLYRK